MTILRASESSEARVVPSTSRSRVSRLRRVIAAIVHASLAVYSLGIFSASSAFAHASRSRKAMVRADTVRLRSAPGKKGKLTALLDAGRVAKVVGRRDGWIKVKLATGTAGWVRADLMSVNHKTTRDHGSFAATHHDDDEDAPRHVRRAKKKAETVVAHSKIKKKKVAPKVVAKAKPKMKPLHVHVAKAHTVIPKAHKAVHTVHLVKVAPVVHAPVSTEVATTTTVAPDTTPNATEVTRPLATVAASGAKSSDNAETIDAVAPTENVSVDKPEVIETVAPAATWRPSKPIKGGVAPAVTVPINRASKRGDRIVRRALSYRGVPYRMGATGRGAFDCSGFTRYILNQSGESLPRTASEQYHHATPISKSELRSGDLVFFKNTYKHGVSHVGIYMGGGKFVHASSRGGVRTSSLNEPFYIHHWAGARRPKIIQGGD